MMGMVELVFDVVLDRRAGRLASGTMALVVRVLLVALPRLVLRRVR